MSYVCQMHDVQPTNELPRDARREAGVLCRGCRAKRESGPFRTHNLRGQQMPSSRPWKMIRYFHAEVGFAARGAVASTIPQEGGGGVVFQLPCFVLQAGERQCKSRTWERQFDISLRAVASNAQMVSHILIEHQMIDWENTHSFRPGPAIPHIDVHAW